MTPVKKIKHTYYFNTENLVWSNTLLVREDTSLKKTNGKHFLGNSEAHVATRKAHTCEPKWMRWWWLLFTDKATRAKGQEPGIVTLNIPRSDRSDRDSSTPRSAPRCADTIAAFEWCSALLRHDRDTGSVSRAIRNLTNTWISKMSASIVY